MRVSFSSSSPSLSPSSLSPYHFFFMSFVMYFASLISLFLLIYSLSYIEQEKVYCHTALFLLYKFLVSFSSLSSSSSSFSAWLCRCCGVFPVPIFAMLSYRFLILINFFLSLLSVLSTYSTISFSIFISIPNLLFF